MVKPLRPNPCPSSTLFPTAQRMDHVPFMLKWPLNCSPASLKVKKIMFCHWFSHMKFISSPFSGSEAAVSKSAISLCFVSVSAGEILKSLCTKLFKFYIILELCFFGVEAHWSPLCLWELSTVCGLAVCWSFEVFSPTQSPFFDEVSVRSVRCASCSLIGLKCSLLWCGLFADQPGEKKTNSVTVLILKIDKCLFEIKNQSLQPSEVLAFISQSKWAFSTGAVKFG